METAKKEAITIEALISASIEKVWRYWTEPKHIMNWNNASEDWHTPKVTNDLRTGGKFVSTMAARDGSMSFDFEGIYDDVQTNKYIAYAMPDGRKVKVSFSTEGNNVKVVETFDPEDIHPVDFQKGGWQSILNNFKKYTEEH